MQREMCEEGPTKSNMNHEKHIGQCQRKKEVRESCGCGCFDAVFLNERTDMNLLMWMFWNAAVFVLQACAKTVTPVRREH